MNLSPSLTAVLGERGVRADTSVRVSPGTGRYTFKHVPLIVRLYAALPFRKLSVRASLALLSDKYRSSAAHAANVISRNQGLWGALASSCATGRI